MIDENKLILHLNDWMLQESFLRYMKNPADTIAECIKAVEEQPKIGGWIPCSEPPKHNKEVLIFNGESYSVGYYDGKAWVNAIHPVEWQEIHHE